MCPTVAALFLGLKKNLLLLSRPFPLVINPRLQLIVPSKLLIHYLSRHCLPVRLAPILHSSSAISPQCSFSPTPKRLSLVNLRNMLSSFLTQKLPQGSKVFFHSLYYTVCSAPELKYLSENTVKYHRNLIPTVNLSIPLSLTPRILPL